MLGPAVTTGMIASHELLGALATQNVNKDSDDDDDHEDDQEEAAEPRLMDIDLTDPVIRARALIFSSRMKALFDVYDRRQKDYPDVKIIIWSCYRIFLDIIALGMSDLIQGSANS